MSQFKFAAIEIKSLDELRKGTNKDVSWTSTKNVPQQGHQKLNDGLPQDRLQRSSAHFGQNSTAFRFVPQQQNPMSQNHAQSHTSNQSHTQRRGDSKAKMPSFELGTVLKDVVSRLNSSSGTTTKASLTSTCASSNTAETGGTGSPIPTLALGSLRTNIFSQADSGEGSGSIFSSNFRQSYEHVVPIRSSTTSSLVDVQSSEKSTFFSGSGEFNTTTQKRPQEQNVAKPDAKRVSPFH